MRKDTLVLFLLSFIPPFLWIYLLFREFEE